jgi:histidinol dehydrogenase
MAAYLKKATNKIEERENKTRDIVKDILNRIRDQEESAVCEMAAEIDNRTRDFILSKEEIKALVDSVPQKEFYRLYIRRRSQATP